MLQAEGRQSLFCYYGNILRKRLSGKKITERRNHPLLFVSAGHSFGKAEEQWSKLK
jgi:hypothetical protein